MKEGAMTPHYFISKLLPVLLFPPFCFILRCATDTILRLKERTEQRNATRMEFFSLAYWEKTTYVTFLVLKGDVEKASLGLSHFTCRRSDGSSFETLEGSRLNGG